MGAFTEILEEARNLLNKGFFQRAFSHIVDVTVYRPDQLFNKIALMVDAGIALRDIKILEYGLYLMNQHARDILAVPALAPSHWFNLGNLQVNILALREYEDGQRCWYDRQLTAPAREAYKKAAERVMNDSLLKSRILKAHGHLLAGIGRDIEAFELYHKATSLNPEDDEAELGRIATLTALSGTAPALKKNLLLEAGGHLALLEKRNSDPGKIDNIQEVKKRIIACLNSSDLSDIKEPEYPRNRVMIDSERGHEMVMYCLQHHLYLSPCTGCRRCDRAIGDAAVIGAAHALVGGNVADRYRRMAFLVGRLTERYRALRVALFEHHHGTDVPDGANYQPHIPEVEGWQPVPIATVGLMSALSGSRVVMEGMAACIALYLEREISPPVTMEQIFGTPSNPDPSLKEVKNPAFHAFWDLWADGIEGLIPGVDLVRLLGDSLSSPQIESLLLDNTSLTEHAMSFIVWLGKLISYLIRIADRDAQGDAEDPPLWPLIPFYTA